MTKRQLVEAVRELNPTARAEFLERFSEPQLQQYLKRLKDAQDHKRLIHCFQRSRGK